MLKKWIYDNLYDYKKSQLTPSRCNFNWFKKRNLENYYYKIIESTGFLDKNSELKERIYYITNNINKQITCKNCGINIKYYRKFCSTKCSSKSIEVRNKTAKTNMKKYGNSCSLNNEIVNYKKNKTWLKKYGCNHIFQNEKIKLKIQNTLRKKHNNDLITNQGQVHLTKDIIEKINSKEFLYNEYVINKKTYSEIARDVGVSTRTIWLHAKSFNIQSRTSSFRSSYENDIMSFIPSNFIILKNVKDIIPPYELDLYLPDYKLAIEFNGIYWHSHNNEKNNVINRHYIKTKLCKRKNIKLLHIFENEWINKTKRQVWKSIINNKLNKNISLNINDCNIQDIKDINIINNFINDNSITCLDKFNLCVGLYNNNELLSILYGYYKNNKLISDFCTKNNHFIKNSKKELIDFFIQKYKPYKIITKIDLRYNDITDYEELNMKYIRYEKPTFMYIKNNKFYGEKNINPIFENEYRKIWNCGKIILEWRSN